MVLIGKIFFSNVGSSPTTGLL